MRWIGRVTHGAALMLVAGVCLPIAASAGYWTVTGSIGETVDASSNPQLETNSSGGSVGSTTGFSLQAIDEMPTLRWETDASVGFSGFWGSGAVGGLDGVNGVATTTVSGATELNTYHASFSASGLPASVSQVFDSGITNTNTTTVSYSGAGGLTHQLNELNAIGLSVSGSSEFFTGDNGSLSSASSASTTKNNLTPYTYLTMGPSWSHTVTPLTTLTLAAGTAWYTANGIAGTDSLSGSVTAQLSESVTAQVQTQLSERLSFTAGGGGDVVLTTGQSGSTFPGGSSDSTSTGFIANVALSYALQNNTGFSAFASHNLSPSSLGSVQELTQAGLTVVHQINDVSRVSLSGIFLDQLPVTSIQALSNQTERQALVLSVGYGRNLSQYWDLQLTYNFTEQDNGDTFLLQSFNNKGSANSNAAFLTIRRTFNLFGTPASSNMYGSPASTGLFGPRASPNMYGSPASPDSFESRASPDLFGSPASPDTAPAEVGYGSTGQQ
jgi:hypothetical protein